MLRVILDTNVLIEGEKDPNSYAARLMRLALAGELLPLISSRTRREYERIINRLVVDSEYRRLVEKFLEQTEQVEVHTRLSGITQDRDDDKFVELAQDGDADYIVTADQHLLDLGNFGESEITTPERFWNTFQEVARDKVAAMGY
jgi:putative PIN family toxin of toxin-antitoxin system